MQDDQHKRKQDMMALQRTFSICRAAKYARPAPDSEAEEVVAGLCEFTAAPNDPLDLSDAEIANIGREAGYTLSGWAERLEAYVKQARRNGVLR